MNYLYVVATKDVLLTLRIRPEMRRDFKIVADLKGASMSTLLHQYIVSLVREEKERVPGAFEPSLRPARPKRAAKGVRKLDDPKAA